MLPVHPLERFSKRQLQLLSLALFLATVALSYLLLRRGELLSHPEAPFGIVSFEFVWDLEGLDRVTAPWGDAGVRLALEITAVDYIFLLCYSTLFAAASLLAGKLVGLRREWLGSIARWTAWLAWVVATCDALENTIGLKLLTGIPTDPWPLFMSLFAAIKFALLVLTILYLLVCLVVIAFSPK